MDRTTQREPLLNGSYRLTYARCLLTVTSGAERGRTFDSEKAIIRAGAAADNDFVLADPAVSRHHLEIQKRDGEYVVIDCGSTNGTFVAGLRVKEVSIRGRSELYIGSTRITLEPKSSELVAEESMAVRCGELVGSSPAMRRLYGIIERVAPTELPVLISGETGTGKEITARELFARSKRSDRPFVTLDCGALPPTLIESALFGHERGAFTGAERARAGVFERAGGGTLFIDELGELPIELQPKLLRALERGEIERVGGDEKIRIDVRIIAATNRDLPAMIERGEFRDDLYYRLAVARVHLPALRERKSDLPELIACFFQGHAEGVARGVHPSALALLERSELRGNVRELMNLLRASAVFARGPEIMPDELELREDAPRVSRSQQLFKDAKSELLATFEKEYVEELLIRHGQNFSKAAREAGIGRRHLHRLVQKYAHG